MTRLIIFSALLFGFFFYGCKTGAESVQGDLWSADRRAPKGEALLKTAESSLDSFDGIAPVWNTRERHFAALGLYEGEISARGLELLDGDLKELWILSEPIQTRSSLGEGDVVVFDSFGARFPARAGAPQVMARYPLEAAIPSGHELIESAGCELEGMDVILRCPSEEAEKELLTKMLRGGKKHVVVELEGLREFEADLVYRLAATEARARYIEPAAEELQPQSIPADIRQMTEASYAFEAARRVAERMSDLSALEELFAITRFTTSADEYYAIAYEPYCDDEREAAFALFQVGEPSSKLELSPSIHGVAMLFEARDRGELLGVGYSLRDGELAIFRAGDLLVKTVLTFDGDPCDC